MKPKQPKFSEFYDYLAIYGTTGSRTDTGGYTEAQSLLRSIWADVRVLTTPSQDSMDETGQRTFTKSLKIKCYKGQIEQTNLVQYNGTMFFVYNLDETNPAFDVVYCDAIQ